LPLSQHPHNTFSALSPLVTVKLGCLITQLRGFERTQFPQLKQRKFRVQQFERFG
jgi:hypothetical protein